MISNQAPTRSGFAKFAVAYVKTFVVSAFLVAAAMVVSSFVA